MSRVILVTEDGTTGKVFLSEEPEVGQIVSIEAIDEGGVPYQHEGRVLEVLAVEEY